MDRADARRQMRRTDDPLWGKTWYIDFKALTRLMEDLGILGVDIAPIVRCEDCKHYKQSDVADRKMCCRKDVDGMPVCYDFLPDDWCKYGER